MTKTTLINENISLGLASGFRSLVHYQGRKHEGSQADIHSTGEVNENSAKNRKRD